MSPRRTAVVAGLVTALVAAVVAGIVGMHTLGLHGSGHHGAAPAAQGAGHLAGHEGPRADPGGAAGDEGGAATGASTSAVAGTAHDHGPASGLADDMAAVCLFLLTLGVLVLLLAPLLRRAPRGGTRLPRCSQHRAPSATPVLLRRPPPTWEHSVVRC